MNHLLMTLLYVALFYGIGLLGYQGYKFLNRKIKESQTDWQLAGFALLLFAMCAVLAIGGLYAFVEIYRFVAG